MACPLATERVWIEKAKYHDAEKDYFEHLSKLLKGSLSNDKNLEEIVKNSTTSEASEILKMQQEQTILEQQQQTATVLKPKKTKKDKLKAKQQQQQQQQQQQIEELSQHDDSIKTDVSLNENSSSVTANLNSNGGGADDELKTKKKKKKKNKSSTEANKVNENHQNKANDIGNNNITTIAVVSASNQDADQDQKIPNNSNKKNDAKQQQQQNQQRPTNIKNLKGSVLGSNQSTLVSEIAKARQHIKSSLEKMDGIAALAASPVGSPGQDVFGRLEKENATLRELVEGLMKSQIESEKRIKALETKLEALSLSQGGQVSSTKKPSPAPASTSKSAAKDDDDDGVDLFASESEEEDEEAAKVREQRLAEYAAKKSKKPALIAKSNVILDVKPWDDETDLKQMETEIRKIATDGLLWGVSKFVPVAFGIKKLSIACVVEDEKVSIDWLQEEIEKLEDYVQSVDVAAFNKI